MVDAQFGVARLSEIYDALDPDRSDLDVYAAMVDEFGASSVLDIGCGTGTLACLLARRGTAVVGVDPASASVEVARGKSGAAGVRWLVGDSTTLPPLEVDLVTLTGNIAQVFVGDRQWQTALVAAHRALRPRRRLLFEIRDPDQQAWRGWTREQTYREVEVPGVGGVENWVELTEVALPLVSFRAHFRFVSGGDLVTSDSTLRFRAVRRSSSPSPRPGSRSKTSAARPTGPAGRWCSSPPPAAPPPRRELLPTPRRHPRARGLPACGPGPTAGPVELVDPNLRLSGGGVEQGPGRRVGGHGWCQLRAASTAQRCVRRDRRSRRRRAHRPLSIGSRRVAAAATGPTSAYRVARAVRRGFGRRPNPTAP